MRDKAYPPNLRRTKTDRICGILEGKARPVRGSYSEAEGKLPGRAELAKGRRGCLERKGALHHRRRTKRGRQPFGRSLWREYHMRTGLCKWLPNLAVQQNSMGSFKKE